MKKSSPANSLAKYIIMKCNNSGMYVWRNNTVGIYDPKTRKYRANVTHRGVGDVVGITRDGKHIEFEVKIGKDKLSDYQIGHSEMLISRGGLYFEIKNEKDIDNLFKRGIL